MLERLALTAIRRAARQFPAVLILGPRQCGKTTLARTCLGGEYLDLEKPSDRQLLEADAELALRRIRAPLVIDEAQVLPGLFPVLRAMIDEGRSRRGRFYLLGSVNPVLVRQISESLAGRVGIVELTPFLYPETAAAGIGVERLWLSGGFPEACLEPDAQSWQAWMENYLRTFVERDVGRFGPAVAPAQMHRFATMLAAQQGGLLNASDLGRALGASYHTVQSYVEILEGHFLVRRLLPYYANIGKRLAKAPKLYLRDSGLLHHLLGISTERQLFASPLRGRSWEGFMVEQIEARERLERTGSRFFFYRTHTGTEVDLVIDRGRSRLGFEFKAGSSVEPRDWLNLQQARKDGIVDHGFVVHMGERSYAAADGVDVVAAAQLLSWERRANST